MSASLSSVVFFSASPGVRGRSVRGRGGRDGGRGAGAGLAGVHHAAELPGMVIMH